MKVSYRFARFLLLFAFLAPRLLSAQDSQRPHAQLARNIDRILADDRLANAFFGIHILDLNSGDLLYSINSEKNFIPASNQKLFTTAAALDLLGPDFRYQTYLYAEGPVRNGTLEGNLIVRGSGDPVIGGRFNNGKRTETFTAWADSLKAAGITNITGSIIGDDDVFDDTPLGYGWSWDDEPYWYAAEISGLSFNDNNVDFKIEAQNVGGPARIVWEPFNTDYVEVVNSTITISPDSSLKEGYARERGTNTIRIYSRVPRGRIDIESLSVNNPTLYFTHVLRETLIRSGISVTGNPIDVDDLPIKPNYDSGSLRRIAVHVSPPLAEIVEVINKESQNLYAEQVLKTIAANRPLPDPDLQPGSSEMGVEIIRNVLARVGVDTSRIQMVDGSGLSRQNLVNPESIVKLLQYMWQHRNTDVSAAFYSSLPIGGRDGSLQYRFTSGPARGNVRAKTGTVSNVSALSGYLTTDDGTPVAFSIICNHYTIKTRSVRDVQDSIVNLLTRFSR